jgi:cytochrome P450
MVKELLWTPYHPAHIADPYTMYSNLREHDPVHLSQTKEWIITRYADVKFVLKSQSFRSGNRQEWLTRGIEYFKNQDEDLQHIAAAINSFILFLNPPDHALIRSFVTKSWNNREVDQLIERNIIQLLDKIDAKEFDLVKDFAKPFPVLVISEIMGIPSDDYLHLKDLAATMQRSLDLYHTYKELVELNECSRKFVDYFRGLIKLKLEKPDDSLTSKLLKNNAIGLEEKHLISICIFIFVASEETTANSIGTGFLNLIRNPKQFEFLRKNPEQIQPAVEELFRYDSPVQLLGRVAKTTVELGGKVIPEGAALTLVLGSANRDPNQFPSPNELQLTRTPNHHIAFGSGMHYCLGDWLGRVQAQKAINLFIKRFPTLSLVDQELRWNKNLSVRGLQSLLVKTE